MQKTAFSNASNDNIALFDSLINNNLRNYLETKLL